MWIDFMRVALQGQPEKTMPQPNDIVTASIDPISGNLLPSGTPGSILEYFRKNDLLRTPIQEDSVTFNTTDNSNTVTDPTENSTQSETKPQSNKEAGEPLF